MDCSRVLEDTAGLRVDVPENDLQKAGDGLPEDHDEANQDDKDEDTPKSRKYIVCKQNISTKQTLFLQTISFPLKIAGSIYGQTLSFPLRYVINV